MAFTAKEVYAIRKWAKENPGLPTEQRRFNQMIDERLSALGAFPTTTTSSTTTTTTA